MIVADAYVIISGGSTAELVEQVNAAIREGWQPQGGVFALPITRGNYGTPWKQAMVRVRELSSHGT